MDEWSIKKYEKYEQKSSRVYDGQPLQITKCSDYKEIVLDIGLLYDKDITF